MFDLRPLLQHCADTRSSRIPERQRCSGAGLSARRRRSALRADSPALLGRVAAAELTSLTSFAAFRQAAASRFNDARCARGHTPCAARRLPRALHPTPPHLCCGTGGSREQRDGGTRGRRCPDGALWRAASSAGSGSARAQRALRCLTCRSLSERSERSERSEFCGTTTSRAAQRSRRAAPTVRVCATAGHRLPRRSGRSRSSARRTGAHPT